MGHFATFTCSHLNTFHRTGLIFTLKLGLPKAYIVLKFHLPSCPATLLKKRLGIFFFSRCIHRCPCRSSGRDMGDTMQKSNNFPFGQQCWIEKCRYGIDNPFSFQREEQTKGERSGGDGRRMRDRERGRFLFHSNNSHIYTEGDSHAIG